MVLNASWSTGRNMVSPTLRQSVLVIIPPSSLSWGLKHWHFKGRTRYSFAPYFSSKYMYLFLLDCEGAFDLAIILDSSGSITDTGTENWNITKNFVADLTRRFNVGQGSNQVRVSRKAVFAEEGTISNIKYPVAQGLIVNRKAKQNKTKQKFTNY